MNRSSQSPFKQFVTYLRGYKFPLAMNVLCNIMMALFMVISIPIIIPFFQILFGRVTPSPVPVPFSLSKIQDWLAYVFGELVDKYSEERALIVVCISFGVIFFLKNLFRYLSLDFYGADPQWNCDGNP